MSDRKERYEQGIIDTASGKEPKNFEAGAPDPEPLPGGGGQHKDHWVLSRHERQQGFIRPVRRSYVHLKCGVETHMGQAIAETYARDPFFYGSTFCAGCGGYFPVGANGEFVWGDQNEHDPKAERVGT